jgi:predicted phosphodiesterase
VRIQVLSDFHVDVRPGFVPALMNDADVVVVAGDVCGGPGRAMAFLRAHIPAPTPIVFVAGNHEYYHHGLTNERDSAPDHARAHRVAWLDDTAVVIGGVRFLGATLWTDFKLFGATSQPLSMVAAAAAMSDYRAIAVRETGTLRITPADTLSLHLKSRAFLERELATAHDGPTVVVTHHCPHRTSVSEKYARDPVTAAFASNLEPLILKYQPALWVHGHTHTSFDYHVGATRIVCNPKGYGHENRAFDAAMVVEILRAF